MREGRCAKGQRFKGVAWREENSIGKAMPFIGEGAARSSPSPNADGLPTGPVSELRRSTRDVGGLKPEAILPRTDAGGDRRGRQRRRPSRPARIGQARPGFCANGFGGGDFSNKGAMRGRDMPAVMNRPPRSGRARRAAGLGPARAGRRGRRGAPRGRFTPSLPNWRRALSNAAPRSWKCSCAIA